MFQLGLFTTYGQRIWFWVRTYSIQMAKMVTPANRETKNDLGLQNIIPGRTFPARCKENNICRCWSGNLYVCRTSNILTWLLHCFCKIPSGLHRLYELTWKSWLQWISVVHRTHILHSVIVEERWMALGSGGKDIGGIICKADLTISVLCTLLILKGSAE